MKFVILCPPRTGSTLLIIALGHHPCIRQGMEIFNPVLEGDASYVDWRERIFNELYGPQDSYVNSIGYLDDERFDLKLLSERFFEDFEGTKILYNQLSLQSNVWDHVCSIPDLRVITLKRNLIESAVSFRLAMETNVWHIESGKGNPARPRMEFPLDYFEWFYDHFCSKAEGIAAKFDPQQIIAVEYRDLVDQWNSTLQSIQNHLGVQPIELPKWYDKRNLSNVEDLIANYQEIRQHYSNHPILAEAFSEFSNPVTV